MHRIHGISTLRWRRQQRWLLTCLAGIISILFAGLLLSACAPLPSSDQGAPEEMIDKAAAQATAIIQQAEATALAVKARAEATALLAQAQQQATALSAGGAGANRQATPTAAQQSPGSVPGLTAIPAGTGTVAAQEMAATQTPQPQLSGYAAVQATYGPDAVQLLKVSLAANGQYIYIQYLAPPELAFYWNQTVVSVEDLETGLVYAEVPFMPLIGALFNKPAHPGQPGYVMVLNLPTPLDYGAHVKVRLGGYEWEDVIVEE